MSRCRLLLPLLLIALALAAWAADVEPFFALVREGDLPGVRAAVEADPALVRAHLFGRQTALHAAAAAGKTEVATYLLDKGAQIEARTSGYSTSLTLAAQAGKPRTVELLLQRGADITGGTDDPSEQPLHVAITFGHPATAKVLLDRGAKLDVRDEYDATPLHWATEGGNAETVTLLLARGLSVDAKDRNGNTPAVEAVDRQADAGVLAALLDAGANPNARSGNAADGDTLLRMARRTTQTDLARVLIEHGARDVATYLAGPDMPDPRTVRGRVFVPARWLAEWLGGTVDVQGKVVTLALGAESGRFAPATPDIVPEPDSYESSLINGTTYVALNDLARALKVSTTWNALALEMVLTQPKSGERLRITVGDPGLTGAQARTVAKTGTHGIWLVNDYSSPLIGALVNGAPTDADDVKMTARTQAVKLYTRTRYLGTATAHISDDGAIAIQSPIAGNTGDEMVAIDGTWAALPRPVRALATDDPQVKRFGREVLDTYSLPKSALRPDDALLADLDGDGADDLLLAASKNEEATGGVVRKGDYQFAAVRRAGKPLLLDGAFFKRSGIDLTASYTFAAALDIDADGAQEVLLTGTVTGGASTTVYALTPTGATPLMTGVEVRYPEHGE